MENTKIKDVSFIDSVSYSVRKNKEGDLELTGLDYKIYGDLGTQEGAALLKEKLIRTRHFTSELVRMGVQL